jgi:hypothetical protein
MAKSSPKSIGGVSNDDPGTLPLHMPEVRELTPKAFAPYGQVISPLRTAGQGAETGYNRVSGERTGSEN